MSGYEKRDTMLTIIMGPMFSGKTNTLLDFEQEFASRDMKVSIVKYKLDTRYTDAAVIKTHDGRVNSGKANVCMSMKLSDVDADIANADVVLIDEGQFFNDLNAFCKRWIGSKTIVVSCLNGDFRQEPFKPIVEILGMADEILYKKSTCTKCGKTAPFTVRTIASEEQTLIGADDIYQPRCRACLSV